MLIKLPKMFSLNYGSSMGLVKSKRCERVCSINKKSCRTLESKHLIQNDLISILKSIKIDEPIKIIDQIQYYQENIIILN